MQMLKILALSSHTMPNVIELLKFLQGECIHMEDAQLITSHISWTHLIQKPTTNLQPMIKKHFLNSQPPRKQLKHVDQTTNFTVNINCIFCKNSCHNIYNVLTFKTCNQQKDLNLSRKIIIVLIV